MSDNPRKPTRVNRQNTLNSVVHVWAVMRRLLEEMGAEFPEETPRYSEEWAQDVAFDVIRRDPALWAIYQRGWMAHVRASSEVSPLDPAAQQQEAVAGPSGHPTWSRPPQQWQARRPAKRPAPSPAMSPAQEPAKRQVPCGTPCPAHQPTQRPAYYATQRPVYQLARPGAPRQAPPRPVPTWMFPPPPRPFCSIKRRHRPGCPRPLRTSSRSKASQPGSPTAPSPDREYEDIPENGALRSPLGRVSAEHSVAANGAGTSFAAGTPHEVLPEPSGEGSAEEEFDDEDEPLADLETLGPDN